ncbi:MAG: amino acid-binding protein [Eggerthellaceae bacterium]
MISQLTVFLENEEGRLASAVRTIADANINMQALFLADTADFGVLRIICDTPQKACEALAEAGYRVRLIDVAAVRVSNKPGELANLMDYLNDNNVNVEYAHCFIVGDYAYDVLKVSDPSLDVKLSAAGFDVCKPEDIYVVD